jgi:hypothetical protein
MSPVAYVKITWLSTVILVNHRSGLFTRVNCTMASTGRHTPSMIEAGRVLKKSMFSKRPVSCSWYVTPFQVAIKRFLYLRSLHLLGNQFSVPAGSSISGLAFTYGTY